MAKANVRIDFAIRAHNGLPDANGAICNCSACARARGDMLPPIDLGRQLVRAELSHMLNVALTKTEYGRGAIAANIYEAYTGGEVVSLHDYMGNLVDCFDRTYDLLQHMNAHLNRDFAVNPGESRLIFPSGGRIMFVSVQNPKWLYGLAPTRIDTRMLRLADPEVFAVVSTMAAKLGAVVV